MRIENKWTGTGAKKISHEKSWGELFLDFLKLLLQWVHWLVCLYFLSSIIEKRPKLAHQAETNNKCRTKMRNYSDIWKPTGDELQWHWSLGVDSRQVTNDSDIEHLTIDRWPNSTEIRHLTLWFNLAVVVHVTPENTYQPWNTKRIGRSA